MYMTRSNGRPSTGHHTYVTALMRVIRSYATHWQATLSGPQICFRLVSNVAQIGALCGCRFASLYLLSLWSKHPLRKKNEPYLSLAYGRAS
jgi:hypothetical protein